MISISVGFATVTPSLVLTGLRDDRAIVGDILTASLSDGTPINSYAWGSRPGAEDYGANADLQVPEALAGGTLYLSVQSNAGFFAIALSVLATGQVTSQITGGVDSIDVQTLAARYVQSVLLPSSDLDTIIVETI